MIPYLKELSHGILSYFGHKEMSYKLKGNLKKVVSSSSSSWLVFANEDLRSLSTLTSTAGTLVANQTDAGETGPRAVTAGKSNVRCGSGSGSDLPPLSLVFE